MPVFIAFAVLYLMCLPYLMLYTVFYVVFWGAAYAIYAPFWLVHQLYDLSIAHPYIAVPIWTWLTLRTTVALFLRYREQIRAVPKEAYLAFVVPMLIGIPVGVVWYCRHIFTYGVLL